MGDFIHLAKTIMKLFLFLSVFSALAFAAESTLNTGDTAWVLAAAALVMIMTPGLGFFYAGMVHNKNLLSLLMHSFVILCLASLLWVVVGYSLAFSPNGGLVGTLDWAFLNGVGLEPYEKYVATIPHLAFMIFQAKFAVITPALIVGAFVGRFRFSAFVIFVILWSLLIYYPVAHWVWGIGGWLRDLGVLDFAGGTVVHITAGVSALACAWLIGRRKDFQSGDDRPSNVPLVVLGTALLWFGWFGFNAGSALGAGGLAASAFVVTNTAAATAALTWMALTWIINRKPSLIGMCIGAVVGLVAITPASGFVDNTAAIIIGLVAGVASYLVVSWRIRSHIDDTLDVFACHGVGGITGAVLTGVFASTLINPAGANGLLMGNAEQVWKQVIAVVAVALYSFLMTSIILKVIGAIMEIREKEEHEEIGLDLAQLGEKAYSIP
ncbi:ammonium transporter [Candidatus Micrarchaeota archaeon]|nr:ammonium transporter [Candidatus Micrarchaeota archaeon]